MFNCILSTFNFIHIKIKKYFNSVDFFIRMMFDFYCFLFLVVFTSWTLVIAEDSCLREDMLIPEYHKCCRTCEDFLESKFFIKMFILNVENLCYCKAHWVMSNKVSSYLSNDGHCVLEEQCIRLSPRRSLPLSLE